MARKETLSKALRSIVWRNSNLSFHVCAVSRWAASTPACVTLYPRPASAGMVIGIIGNRFCDNQSSKGMAAVFRTSSTMVSIRLSAESFGAAVFNLSDLANVALPQTR